MGRRSWAGRQKGWLHKAACVVLARHHGRVGSTPEARQPRKDLQPNTYNLLTTDMSSPFLRGLRDGIPIALGYYAVAFSLGIIASRAGLDAAWGFVCSFFTRASAGEYGGYTLIAASAPYAEVVALTLVANLRYLLMSTAMSQRFSEKTSLLKRILVGCCMTDEVFGVSIAYQGKYTPAYTFGAAAISTLFWAAGNASGVIAGNVLPVNVVTALSVALYGMFLAIIIPPFKKDRAIGVAVLVSFVMSGACSVAPLVSALSDGTRTILLTIIISAAAAVLKPVADEENTKTEE